MYIPQTGRACMQHAGPSRALGGRPVGMGRAENGSHLSELQQSFNLPGLDRGAGMGPQSRSASSSPAAAPAKYLGRGAPHLREIPKPGVCVPTCVKCSIREDISRTAITIIIMSSVVTRTLCDKTESFKMPLKKIDCV